MHCVILTTNRGIVYPSQSVEFTGRTWTKSVIYSKHKRMRLILVLASCVLWQGQGFVIDNKDKVHSLASAVKEKVKFFSSLQNEEVASPQKLSDDWPPDFCHQLACPKYQVENRTETYEVRLYSESNWVTTSETGVDFDDAMNKMFMRLFEYISGANVKKEKIAMTVPVAVKLIPGQGPTCVDNFTMSFYMTTKDSPEPTSANVMLTSFPPITVYVRSFGGRPGLNEWLSNATALANDLPSSAAYVTDYYYTGGYDSPFRLTGRHNEIWFIAK